MNITAAHCSNKQIDVLSIDGVACFVNIPVTQRRQCATSKLQHSHPQQKKACASNGDEMASPTPMPSYSSITSYSCLREKRAPATTATTMKWHNLYPMPSYRCAPHLGKSYFARGLILTLSPELSTGCEQAVIYFVELSVTRRLSTYSYDQVRFFQKL